MQKTQETGFHSWVRKIPWSRRWQTHSSILAWRIPWTEEPGGLQSMGLSQTQLNNWTHTHTHTHTHTCCHDNREVGSPIGTWGEVISDAWSDAWRLLRRAGMRRHWQHKNADQRTELWHSSFMNGCMSYYYCYYYCLRKKKGKYHEILELEEILEFI